MPQVLDTASFWTGAIAKKTKGLKAKPVSSLVVDATIIEKLLLDTLEGIGPIVVDQMYCLGELGDVWLQDPIKLLKKYDVKSITKDGWMNCLPKPENEVEFFEVSGISLIMDTGFDPNQPIYITGTWGKEIDGVKNLQALKAGDFIARQTYDHTDQWVVARKIWTNSYEAQ